MKNETLIASAIAKGFGILEFGAQPKAARWPIFLISTVLADSL